jgi:ABC-type multidrug transport system ATPase subunit
MSAIMGPSGSGKTTLLNILSGFITSNQYRGSIRVNGKPRDIETFRKQSTYIMQEQSLHSLLTLRETMNFAVKLKTGNVLNDYERNKKIMMILGDLGLEPEVDTFVDNLSGGQQKRLSIAMELVDDPLILFLDEPTTGLDSSSSSQCIRLLKQLALEGKTIICTIHTPSALLFELFDNIYALADGQCIYQGWSKNLVPFLAELDLICPETYNPADFLLEIASNEYGEQNQRLCEKIEQGMNVNFRKPPQTMVAACSSHKHSAHLRPDLTSSFINQVIQLTARNMLFNKRDISYVLIRLVVYVLVGVLVGVMYYQIGNEARHMINIFKSIYLMVAFLMYTSLYSLTVRCECTLETSSRKCSKLTFDFFLVPLDLPIIQREHFNRWYSTAAHYIALNLADVPVLIICSITFTVVAYIMTNHPLEDFRLGTVLAIGLAMSFTSQAYGIFAGSIVELKVRGGLNFELQNFMRLNPSIAVVVAVRCASYGVSNHLRWRTRFHERCQSDLALDVRGGLSAALDNDAAPRSYCMHLHSLNLCLLLSS